LKPPEWYLTLIYIAYNHLNGQHFNSSFSIIKTQFSIENEANSCLRHIQFKTYISNVTMESLHHCFLFTVHLTHYRMVNDTLKVSTRYPNERVEISRNGGKTWREFQEQKLGPGTYIYWLRAK